MTCPGKNKRDQNPQDDEILIDYCAGVLDAARAAEFELHIAGCADCAALVAGQKAAWNALDEFTAAQISPDFDARLYARIALEQDRPAWKRAAHRWTAAVRDLQWTPWKPALGGAVACAALAVAFLAHSPRAIDPARPADPAHAAAGVVDSTRPARTEAVDIDQVEHTLEDLDLLTPSSASRM